jgi:hypothetical protein
MTLLASAVPALLSVLSLAPADGEAAVSGSFVTKLGDEVVAFESYTRTSRRLEGDIVLRVPATTRYHYALSFESDGSAKRSEFTIKPLGAPGVDDPRRLILDFGGESVRLTSIIRGEQQGAALPKGDARHVVFLGGYGSSHGLYGSLAMYEHLLARVKVGPEPVRIEAVGADSGKPVTRFIKRTSQNAAAVDYFKMAWTTLTLDEAGRILSVDATATTERTRTERVEFKDIDKVEKEFLDLDRAGKGLGAASPNVETKAKVDGASIVLKHGSPRLRGRTGVMKALVDSGAVWRTGANEATTLETNRDLLLGNTLIRAGKYSLWTQASAAGVLLIVNLETGHWGTSYKAAQDLVRVPLRVSTADAPVESFVIEVAHTGSGTDLRFRWDTFVWSVAIAEARK